MLQLARQRILDVFVLTPAALQEAVRRALDLYQSNPEQWLALMQTGMRQDWSWDRIALDYEKLYEAVSGEW